MTDLLAVLDDFAERHDADVSVSRSGGGRMLFWRVMIAFGGSVIAEAMNHKLHEALERALLEVGAL